MVHHVAREGVLIGGAVVQGGDGRTARTHSAGHALPIDSQAFLVATAGLQAVAGSSRVSGYCWPAGSRGVSFFAGLMLGWTHQIT